MAKNNKQKEMVKKSGSGKWVFLVIVLVVIVAMFFVFSSGSGSNGPTNAQIETFAKCITEKGAVMYGAFWCPHCARVKKAFGEAFRYVNYVECDPRGDNEQSLLCIDKGIENYATFEFNGDASTRLVGEPTFEELSAKTGCPVPGASG